MPTKYYICGSMSEREGLTLATAEYDEEGNFISGTQDPKKNLYKAKEVTFEEFEKYRKMMFDPNTLNGLFGIVNEEGAKAAQEYWDEQKAQLLAGAEPRIALTVKKIKKQLDLGIIEQADIDTEIELNGMKEFAEIIKERVAS